MAEKRINTLSSLPGRALLNDIFKELRYEKQYSSFATLMRCWRLCINEKDINKFTNTEVNILHSLGFFGGTGLWLEEIVNRYYFSTINSFVYFGAAILLILIGVRRFSEAINDQVVIIGIAFEALMLMLMFFIMLFTPNDEISIDNQSSGNSGDELLAEVGEIGRDFAASLIQLEKLNESFNTIIESQSKLLVNVEAVARNSADASTPNPRMLELMKQTNTALEEFSDTVEKLNQTSQSLLKEEIELTVRREVERILIDKVRQ
jgi:hypothetical protein